MTREKLAWHRNEVEVIREKQPGISEHNKRVLYVDEGEYHDGHVFVAVRGPKGGEVPGGWFSRAELLAALGVSEMAFPTATPVDAETSHANDVYDNVLTRRYTVEQRESEGAGWLVKSSHHARIAASWAAMDEAQGHIIAERNAEMRVFDNEAQTVVWPL